MLFTLGWVTPLPLFAVDESYYWRVGFTLSVVVAFHCRGTLHRCPIKVS